MVEEETLVYSSRVWQLEPKSTLFDVDVRNIVFHSNFSTHAWANANLVAGPVLSSSGNTFDEVVSEIEMKLEGLHIRIEELEEEAASKTKRKRWWRRG